MFTSALFSLAFLSQIVRSDPPPRSSLVCDAQNGGCFQQVGDKENLLQVGIALPSEAHCEGPPTEFIAWVTINLENYGFAGYSLDKESKVDFIGWGAPCTVPACQPDCQREVNVRLVDGDKLEPLDGPIVTLLPGTRHNDTHLVTFYRCQNCFNSTKLEIDFESHDAPISLIRSSFIPDPIADPKAPLRLQKPDTDIRDALMDFANARFDDYFSRVPPAIKLPCPPTPDPVSPPAPMDPSAPPVDPSSDPSWAPVDPSSSPIDPSWTATSTSTSVNWTPSHAAQGEL